MTAYHATALTVIKDNFTRLLAKIAASKDKSLAINTKETEGLLEILRLIRIFVAVVDTEIVVGYAKVIGKAFLYLLPLWSANA